MSRFIRPIIWSRAVGSTLMVAVALKFSFSFMICSLPLIFSEEKNSPFKVSNPFPSSVCCVLCAAVHCMASPSSSPVRTHSTTAGIGTLHQCSRQRAWPHTGSFHALTDEAAAQKLLLQHEAQCRVERLRQSAAK